MHVPGELAGAYGVMMFVGNILLNFLFAAVLYRDASGAKDGKRRATVLPAFVWALAGLLLGWIAVALYWIIAYSNFARREDEAR